MQARMHHQPGMSITFGLHLSEVQGPMSWSMRHLRLLLSEESQPQLCLLAHVKSRTIRLTRTPILRGGAKRLEVGFELGLRRVMR